MKKAFIASLNIAILFCFITCKKKDAASQLPDASHSGANTLGFLANGSTHSTSGKPDNVITKGVDYLNLVDGTLVIEASSRNSLDFRFSLRIYWNNSTGIFPLTSKYPCRVVYSDFSGGSTVPSGTNQYENDDAHTGEIVVTYWDGNILSGTFNMNLVNDSGDVVHITNGRFDINK